jgi:hypothetical protein
MGRSNDGTKFMNNKPRVSFKKPTFRPGRMRNLLIKSHFDDDVLMSASSNNNSRQVVNVGRGKSFVRGRNSPLPHNNIRDSRSRQIPISLSNWYKIIVSKVLIFDKFI